MTRSPDIPRAAVDTSPLSPAAPAGYNHLPVRPDQPTTFRGAPVWAVLLTAPLAGCQPPPAASADPVPLDAPGLHNLYRVSDRLYSGGSPEGDAGFAALARLGVKTVVSVDGATPDVAAAKRHGLRYVHLPLGYDGIPRDRVLALAKVARDLPGPVYVHCHHGKHRGPAAVAVIQLCTDLAWDAAKAEAWLTTAGTDPRYTGLTGLPRSLTPPDAAELARAPADWPAVAKVADLTRVMVSVDERWDHLKLVKAAGWTVPTAHPDVDPPHEAVQLGEHYREAGRLGDVKRRGAEFVRQLGEAESAAGELERALRATPVDAGRAAAEFARSAAACTNCHDRFRDRPPPVTSSSPPP
jgi:protein tyrosine phosphatase (PTP) superfamily phosphohydrolase (DUF442 family)